jgi:hypothetical protein
MPYEVKVAMIEIVTINCKLYAKFGNKIYILTKNS